MFLRRVCHCRQPASALGGRGQSAFSSPLNLMDAPNSDQNGRGHELVGLELQESPPLFDSTLPAAPGESLSLCNPADDFLKLGSEYQSTVPTPGAGNTTCGNANLPIFTDGFESGDTSEWTNVVQQ